ncbi:hypothetical protein [Pseudonocardia sp. NPDC049154]|uniref:hypothetical protein n=1 Tax=Pseudonocardia sp. NPDC049154 TaxID=3155501 RepID=UPI0033DFC95C
MIKRMRDLADELDASFHDVKEAVNALAAQHGADRIVVHEDEPPEFKILREQYVDQLITEEGCEAVREMLGPPPEELA